MPRSNSPREAAKHYLETCGPWPDTTYNASEVEALLHDAFLAGASWEHRRDLSTVQAARQLGRCLKTLERSGITDAFSALQAGLSATPDGGTRQRAAVLKELRK